MLKKYLVDNNNADDTELDENATVFRLVIQAVSVMYRLLFRYVLIVVVFESVYQIMTQTHALCNGLYNGEQRLLSIINQAGNYVCQMDIQDDNKDVLGNRDVGARLHYFINSNNGKIPEDELNYQTSNINDWFGIDIDVQVRVVKNNNSFSDYDDDVGNDSDDTHGIVLQHMLA